MDKRVRRGLARVSAMLCCSAALAAWLTGCKAGAQGGAAPVTATVTISGAPAAAATTGTPYLFQPTATSSAGSAISFSIQHEPAWATFNAASGRLTGTPAARDTGTYANIVISASDGAATAALAPFTIVVANPATEAATILWTPPAQNLDGTALTNLAGFHVYYGNTANALTQMVTIGNPTTITYTLSNLSQGTWYFAVSAYTADNVESDLSAVVSKTI
jgi:Putative Ig domain